MNDYSSPYPLKLVSRSVTVARANKLRLSWFVVGTSFGIGFAVMLAPTMNLSTTKNIQAASLPMPAAAMAQLAPSAGSAVPATIQTAANTSNSDDDTYPLTLTLKVKTGDTLINLLTDAGVANDEAYNVLQAVSKVYDPKKLDIGKSLSVRLDKGKDNSGEPVIASLALPTSATSSIEVLRKGDDTFEVKKIDAPVERKLSRAGGKISGSLYETGMDSGLPPSLIAEIINAYSYDVDFQRDIKEGDAMDVLYEKLETKDGVAAGRGAMIFAELTLGDRSLRIYRHVDADGHADYFNEKGESIRKALLRTPVNGAKITSGYGMRNHPILGYTKMHRGVDFGAAMGTPIFAAGDGVVEFEGRKGGYGNYLKIKHNSTYASGYGHISRFAAGLHAGSRVRQGQVVAYVGMTGMATGPHLHYEIMVNNEQVNPSNVKFQAGDPLKGKELNAFHKTMETVQAQLNSMPRGGSMAMADTEKTHVN